MFALSPDQRIAAERLRAALTAEITKRQERAQHLQEIARDADGVRADCKLFRNFIAASWHLYEPGVRYLPNWHVDAIGEHLQAIHERKITRFYCNMPPGLMKSTTISVAFPAWEWGPMDEAWLRYFTTSYEAGYAWRDSRKHRDLVETEWYQTLWPHVKLTKRGEDEFENTAKGGRKAVPFKRLTAGRGNRLIIDDPHSTEGAESEAERRRATRMFRESASSRLNDQERDAIIIIMQRLHPDDLCGVIDELQLPYVKLILPMEYVRSLSIRTPYFEDPRRDEGELLHPAFMGREKVEEKKTEAGKYAWDTQYQQRARARDGSYFFSSESLLEKRPAGNTFEYYPAKNPAACDGIFSIVDSASKVGKTRDGTGVVHFAFTLYPKVHLHVIDWDITQIEAALLTGWMPSVFSRGAEIAKLCGARNGYAGCWVEDKDSGVMLLQHGRLKSWPVKPCPSEFTALGKDGRATSVSGYVNNSLVTVCEGAYEKQVNYHGHMRNHFWNQVTMYRVGRGTPEDEDELFDCFCYGVSAALGDKKGF